MGNLNGIDAVILLVYFVTTFGVGLYVSRNNRTEDDYFLAGRRLPWYAVCLSLFATNISTNNFIGFSGLGYSTGLAISTFEWMTVLGVAALAFIFLPYYQRTGVVTLPEFLELRYDHRLRTLLSVAALLLYVFMELATVFYTGCLTLETVLGIPFMVALAVIVVSVGVYTVHGGLTAVVWTDSFQAVVLYGGGIIVAVYGLAAVGGLGDLVHATPDKFHVILPADHPAFPWPGILLGGLPLLAIWFWASSQLMVQRALGARSQWDARMGTIMVGYLKLLGPFIMVMPGIIGFKLYPGLEKPDSAYPLLVRELVPRGLSGIVLAGLIAALMSTASSVLNTCSTLFTHDLYLRHWRPNASQRQIVLVGRVATGVVMLITVLWVPVVRQQESIVLYSINLLGYLASPFVAIFLLGVFTRWATATACLVTALASVPVTMYFEWSHPGMSYLYRIPLVFLFCVGLIAALSRFTSKKAPEAIERLLWRAEEVFRADTGLLAPMNDPASRDYRTSERLPLYMDYRAWAALNVVLVILLFILFR